MLFAIAFATGVNIAMAIGGGAFVCGAFDPIIDKKRNKPADVKPATEPTAEPAPTPVTPEPEAAPETPETDATNTEADK